MKTAIFLPGFSVIFVFISLIFSSCNKDEGAVQLNSDLTVIMSIAGEDGSNLKSSSAENIDIKNGDTIIITNQINARAIFSVQDAYLKTLDGYWDSRLTDCDNDYLKSDVGLINETATALTWAKTVFIKLESLGLYRIKFDKLNGPLNETKVEFYIKHVGLVGEIGDMNSSFRMEKGYYYYGFGGKVPGFTVYAMSEPGTEIYKSDYFIDFKIGNQCQRFYMKKTKYSFPDEYYYRTVLDHKAISDMQDLSNDGIYKINFGVGDAQNWRQLFMMHTSNWVNQAEGYIIFSI